MFCTQPASSYYQRHPWLRHNTQACSALSLRRRTLEEMNALRPMTVLTVCTGNICRSPAAERLFAASLGPSIQVSSVGTAALVGRGIEPTMAHLLDDAGIITGEFSARQITEDIIQSSSLILTMTREHRSRVVEMVPGAVRRTYTLREFARIAAEARPLEINLDTPIERLRYLMSVAPYMRSKVGDAEDDDVPDPYGRDLSNFALSFEIIRQAVKMIATVGDSSNGFEPDLTDTHQMPPGAAPPPEEYFAVATALDFASDVDSIEDDFPQNIWLDVPSLESDDEENTTHETID